MLARFVVPAARLDEFEACMDGQPPAPVSALAGANLESDVERIARSRMKIDAIEIKAADAREQRANFHRFGFFRLRDFDFG